MRHRFALALWSYYLARSRDNGDASKLLTQIYAAWEAVTPYSGLFPYATWFNL